MKTTFKRFTLSAAFTVLAITLSFGQIGDFGNILTGGAADAELMMTEYLRPVANALGANLNGGWYNTAKVHGTLGFHLNFNLSTSIIPDAAKTYDLGTLGLSTAAAYSDPMAPTFFGEKGSGPNIAYTEELEFPPGSGTMRTIPLVDYDHPGGVGIGFLPSPMINAGVGLPKGFEIMGRYMPTMKFKGLSTGLWGIGIKHDIGQWIPFVKRIPVLHFSLQYGYTNLKVNAKLKSVTPLLIGADDLTTTKSWDDQNFDLNTQGHTANLLIGANLPVVCFYGGLGISTTKSNLKLNGDFPVPTVNPASPLSGPVVTDASAVSDPLDIEIENKDGGVLKPRLNAGIRFKFAVITLEFDYIYANYSVVTTGLGISFR
ncbi:DUF6588 family protein [Bacteroidota bacterium]